MEKGVHEALECLAAVFETKEHGWSENLFLIVAFEKISTMSGLRTICLRKSCLNLCLPKCNDYQTNTKRG
jgi:hypothetical protein